MTLNRNNHADVRGKGMWRRIVITCSATLLFGAALHAGDYRVTNIQLLADNGGRVSWSAARNIIAFDRLSPNGFYDVYTMNADGSNVVCLTCDDAMFANLNKGNPDWHPSGDFLAVQIENDAGGPAGARLSRPGVGINNDLWIMDAAGGNFWRVTTGAGAVLHPHFSRKGDKLLWSERISGGAWVLRLGDFTITGGVPSVQNVQTLTPGAHQLFYESHGFSPDDSKIYFSGNLEGQSQNGIDIYSLDLKSNNLLNLTNTPDEWDEHAQVMPNGKVLWISSRQAFAVPGQLKTEFWMMDPDGSNQKKLSWFNDSRGPNFIPGGVACADSEWNAVGTQLVAYVIEGGSDLGGTGRIYLLSFEPAATTLSSASFGRPPLAPGSIVTTFAGSLAESFLTAGLPLPTELGGVSVTVTDANGVNRQAQLLFVSPLQANWLIPDGTAPGPAVITARNPDGVQARDTVDIEAVAPALFSITATGSGLAAAYVVHVAQNGGQSTESVFNCSAGSCAPNPVGWPAGGQLYLVIFGTGFQRRSGPATAQIGNQSVPASYAGAQGTFAGLDQLNVLVPESLRGAGLVDVSATVDGVSTNTVQVQFQ